MQAPDAETQVVWDIQELIHARCKTFGEGMSALSIVMVASAMDEKMTKEAFMYTMDRTWDLMEKDNARDEK